MCDKLSDKATDKWAAVLADRVTRTRWDSEEDTTNIQHLLLTLSTDLQKLVVQQIGDIIPEVMCQWPSVMQHVRTIRIESHASYTVQKHIRLQ